LSFYIARYKKIESINQSINRRRRRRRRRRECYQSRKREQRQTESANSIDSAAHMLFPMIDLEEEEENFLLFKIITSATDN